MTAASDITRRGRLVLLLERAKTLQVALGENASPEARDREHLLALLCEEVAQLTWLMVGILRELVTEEPGS